MEHAAVTSGIDRVIHVTLSEAEWKAFIAAAPQPVDWLRERIQELVRQQATDDKRS